MPHEPSIDFGVRVKVGDMKYQDIFSCSMPLFADRSGELDLGGA